MYIYYGGEKLKYLLIVGAPIFTLAVLATLITAAVCFFKIFYSFRKKNEEEDEHPIPEGDVYEVFRNDMVRWIDEARSYAHTEVSIRSYDGLKLYGMYYEFCKGATVEILFHGYKGTSLRDLSGGIYRCRRLGHNVLVVDHRASGKSEGRVITFGIKESRDCRSWIDFVLQNIDKDARIIIGGISMGAATVMTAAGFELPENVVGVVADCGYTSTEEIVKKVMTDMKLPPNLLYPFARLGAILFGRFDPNERAPIKSMANCSLPIIFFHGDVDGYVPCYMSEQNFSACTSQSKRLVIVKDADHGLCLPVDPEAYIRELESFFG